jgi:hypothetical protein
VDAKFWLIAFSVSIDPSRVREIGYVASDDSRVGGPSLEQLGDGNFRFADTEVVIGMGHRIAKIIGRWGITRNRDKANVKL